MGNSISSIPDKMVASQKQLQAEMMEKNITNQIKLQDRMMRKQIAFQMALTKERTYWFAGVTSAGWLGVITRALKGLPIPPTILGPVTTITVVTAYQADMAFGNKMERVKRMADEIESDPNNWFVPIETAESLLKSNNNNKSN